MDNKQELLTIMMEELAELQVECSKLIRFGGNTSDNFVKELGDVLTMINLCNKNGMFSWSDVEKQEQKKLEKLKQWSSLLNEC